MTAFEWIQTVIGVTALNLVWDLTIVKKLRKAQFDKAYDEGWQAGFDAYKRIDDTDRSTR